MSQPTQIQVRHLQVGAELEHDIFDDQGVLLLKAGRPVTDRFLRALRNRGISEVRCEDQPQPPADARAYQTAASRAIDQAVDTFADGPAPADARWPKRRATRFARLDALSPEHRRQRLTRTRKQLGQAVGRFKVAGPAVASGSIDVDLFEGDLRALVELVGNDPYTALLARELRGGDVQLYEEGVHAAVLAAAVATYMGFDETDTLDVAFATMFCDLGVLRLPAGLRDADHLTADQRAALERHPVHTADALDQAGARLNRQIIAYQTHERIDGNGYPRQRHGMFIHPLARVAAVAHAFITRCAVRPHRDAVLPYDTMVAILRDSRAGRFDPVVVRALLDVMSLFPVGSFVQLSDHRAACVWQSNLQLHTDPVVAPLQDNGALTDELIDLAKIRRIKIVRAIPHPLTRCA